MPTPDASAFTTQNKMRAVSAQVRTSNQKVMTRLYQYVPAAANITDFLPSFSNKRVRPLTGPFVRYEMGNSVAYNGYRRNGLPPKTIN
jgi:hypothetical protein